MNRARALATTAVVGVLAIILLAVYSCRTPAETQNAQQFHLQNTANWVVKEMLYIKDPRTNICFAYYRRKGPTLATVPCEAIPPHLLGVAEVAK